MALGGSHNTSGADPRKAEEAYRQAVARWPGVRWALRAYLAHLRGQWPPHPLDLFLGGAAGHRAEGAWGAIEGELAPQVQRILSRQPLADYTVDDLWSDARTKLMADDPEAPPLAEPAGDGTGQQPARIVRYRGLVPLLNYLVLVAKRAAIQRQRQRRPALSLSGGGENGDGSTDGMQLADEEAATPDARLHEREAAGRLQQALTAAFARLSAEQQFLITMVYRRGMRQKVAGAMLGWSEFKTSRSLTDAMNKLRKALEDVADAQWTPALESAWSECVEKCWSAVQEAPPAAS